MEACEHEESSPIGTCVICERTVCTDCYNEVFGAMVCDQHPGLEDESEWELAGHYNQGADLDERRYTLEDAAVTALVVDHDDEGVELYVPAAEKEDAYAALRALGSEESFCGECMIEYSADLDACPVCGAKNDGSGSQHSLHDEEGL